MEFYCFQYFLGLFKEKKDREKEALCVIAKSPKSLLFFS